MSGIRTNTADGREQWPGVEPTPRAARYPHARLRRSLYFFLIVVTTLAGSSMMFAILRGSGMGLLHLVSLGLFTIVFAWIAASFWTACIGFMLQLSRRDPLSLRRLPAQAEARPALNGRGVLVMPVYNEEPERALAGLEATCLSLLDAPGGGRFDAFLLSDSDDPEVLCREVGAVRRLQQRLAGRMTLHYRRRRRNTGRKAGNIAEFCRRWGRRYDYMVVLDADSVMSGRTIVAMSEAMERDPDLGLLQTVPMPVRQKTLFGRFVQFAAALYGPMLGAGQSFWQLDAANYWGHNAIIRVQAFMDHCGLPRLPGKPPLGGEILSHDFVEAALMRRAGWEVRMDPALGGSFEEMPSNLLDFAKRDRRWTQGNLQHLRLLLSPGLHPLSRLHFLFGAMAYLASVFWLLLLAVSTVDAMNRFRAETGILGVEYQFYPDWPVARPELIISLLLLTIGLLVLPKVLGVLLALVQRPDRFGGRGRLVAGATLEVLFAILIAPIMMAFHTGFVLGVLTGYTVVWGTQERGGRLVPWREACRHTLAAMVVGGCWAGVTFWYAPGLFLWLCLVWSGLLLAAPLVRWTSSLAAGASLRRAGLLLAPSETAQAPVLAGLDGLLRRDHPHETESGGCRLPAASLPPEVRGVMPTQVL